MATEKQVSKSRTLLKPHQDEVARRLEGQKGLVVYHGLGSGKTLTAVNAHQKKTTAITPASLQDNYRKEEKKLRRPKAEVQSFEKSLRTPKPTEQKDLLVVDEAHRLRNSGKIQQHIKSLRTGHNKALLLTATPIQNHPSDIAPLVNIAANKKILPEGKLFNERYLRKKYQSPGILKLLMGHPMERKTVPQNLSDFKNRAKPWVHHYDQKTEGYPTKVDRTEWVELSPKQRKMHDFYLRKLPYSARQQVRRNLESSGKNQSQVNSFLSKTRQIVNKVEDSQPKLDRVKENLNRPGRHLVYSNFLDSGIVPLYEQLKSEGKSVGLYTGQQSRAEKKKLVDQYNRGKLNALLVSSAGGEGLDLKKTRAVHLLEPHWHNPKIDQVVGRAIRYQSHEGLPENQKEVEVIKYLAKNKKRWFRKASPTSDEYLYNVSKKKEELNNQFLNALKS